MRYEMNTVKRAARPLARGADRISIPVEQPIEIPLSDSQAIFITNVALPQLNAIRDKRIAERLADSFWNLCTWESDRAKSLDSKASGLLGLTSIAAAVVTVGGIGIGDRNQLILRCISICLFLATVITCLFAILGKKYGSLVDREIFESISAHKTAVGPIPRFKSRDQYICYLGETILQRWLLFRKHVERNDRKFKWVLAAQIVAVVAVASLLSNVVLALVKL
jgi:hypothetical protein